MKVKMHLGFVDGAMECQANFRTRFFIEMEECRLGRVVPQQPWAFSKRHRFHDELPVAMTRRDAFSLGNARHLMGVEGGD